jgi:hypothetical protein
VIAGGLVAVGIQNPPRERTAAQAAPVVT